MPDFLLPDLGEGLEEAEIVTWLVGVGDRVTVDQVVVEVETAKAAVEVPVPFAGTVSALHADPGATVAVGAPLISIATDPPEPGVVSPSADQVDDTSGNVLVGYGTSTVPRRHRRRRVVAGPHLPGLASVPPATANVPPATPKPRTGPEPTPATAEPHAAPDRAAAAEPAIHQQPATTPPGVPGQSAAAEPVAAARPVRVVSPLVRRLAREAGLDLRQVTGTGPAGLVLRRDVEQALAAAASTPAVSGVRGEQRIPIRGLRKTTAENLARSRREIPEATVWVDVDATELLAARAALNASTADHPVSLLALLARFTVLGLRRYPELNAHVDADEIVVPEHVHLGFAAQTQRGLVVPVVRNAHRLTTRELSAALTEHTEAARSGRLHPADLTGGTITVNNYGVFGVDGSAAIINHPEVAIVGIGRIIDRPWVVDGRLAVRKVTELTLAFDHRVCDGGVAGGFLRYLADCIESPLTALGDL